MSPQPGWYAAPGEPGLLRLWDGLRWTQDRQPLPPATDAQPVIPTHWTPEGQSDPHTAPVPNLLSTIVGAQRGGAAWSPDGLVGAAPHYMADEQHRADGTAVAGGALLADGVVGFGRNRVGVVGAIRSIAIGGIFLLFSWFLLKPLIWDPMKVGPGETAVQATVLAQNRHQTGDGVTSCSPEVSYQVDRQVYFITSTWWSSDCPAAGSSAKVIYPVADPADGRVVMTGPLVWAVLIFPAVALLLLVSGLWTLLVRLTSIGAGTGLLVKGLGDRRRIKGG